MKPFASQIVCLLGSVVTAAVASASPPKFTRGHFYTPTNGGWVIEWDEDLEEISRVRVADMGGFAGAVFNDKPNLVLIARNSDDVRIIEVDAAGRVLREFRTGHTSLLRGSYVDFDPATGWYAFANRDRITVIDRDFHLIGSSPSFLDRGSGVTFSFDGTILATDQFEHRLAFIGVDLQVEQFMVIAGWVNVGMDLSANGDLLYASFGDGAVYRVDLSTGDDTPIVSGFGYGRLADVHELPNGDLALMGYGGPLYRYSADGTLLDISPPFDLFSDAVAYLPRIIGCLGDIHPQPDGDGTVGEYDLRLILAAFGTECQACPEDLAPEGGDGRVTIADIVTAIMHVGECE